MNKNILEDIMEEKICQSCGMPMKKPDDFGTEENGNQNTDYCCHCWEDGTFSEWANDMTLESMIEFNVKFCLEHEIHKTLEEAEKACKEFYPKLKRWAAA